MRNKDKQRNRVGTRKIAPPNYLIVCEGKKTEPNYFKGLKQKINEKFENRINIEIKGEGRNTESLVEYTKRYVNSSSKIYGQVWIVFDKDDFTDEQFNSAIRANDYYTAWSNPNFELWILSHFKQVNVEMSSKQMFKEVELQFKKNELGKYNKNDGDIFEKLTGENRLNKAIENSKIMYESFNGGCSASNKNPATTVFLLVEDLIEYID